MTIDEPGVEIAGPEIHNISAGFFHLGTILKKSYV